MRLVLRRGAARAPPDVAVQARVSRRTMPAGNRDVLPSSYPVRETGSGRGWNAQVTSIGPMLATAPDGGVAVSGQSELLFCSYAVSNKRRQSSKPRSCSAVDFGNAVLPADYSTQFRAATAAKPTPRGSSISTPRSRRRARCFGALIGEWSGADFSPVRVEDARLRTEPVMAVAKDRPRIALGAQQRRSPVPRWVWQVPGRPADHCWRSRALRIHRFVQKTGNLWHLSHTQIPDASVRALMNWASPRSTFAKSTSKVV